MSWRPMLSLAALAAGGSCYLPVGTGTPQPASTVGKGGVGLSLSAEAPTLNLNAGDSDVTDTYAEAPAAAGKLDLAYGLTDSTDIEGGLEMSLYFFVVPLPIGGSVGIRQQLLAGDHLDLAVAGRVGAVRASSEDAMGQEDSASAEYLQIAGTGQLVYGGVRPLASIALMPARITRNVEDEPSQEIWGFAGSATLGLMFQIGSLQFGPYVTGTYFTSDQFAGRPFGSGGILIAIRPDRHRAE